MRARDSATRKNLSALRIPQLTNKPDRDEEAQNGRAVPERRMRDARHEKQFRVGTDNTLIAGQDPAWQSRMWMVERIGWGAMLLVLICASVGIFGHGPFSKAVVEQASLRLEYDRIGRYRVPITLRFVLPPAVNKQDHLTLWLPNKYLRHMEIVGIQPQPERMDLSSDGLRFTFTAEGEPSTGMITFHLRPDTVGTIAGAIAFNDNQSMTFQHFIHP